MSKNAISSNVTFTKWINPVYQLDEICDKAPLKPVHKLTNLHTIQQQIISAHRKSQPYTTPETAFNLPVPRKARSNPPPPPPPPHTPVNEIGSGGSSSMLPIPVVRVDHYLRMEWHVNAKRCDVCIIWVV